MARARVARASLARLARARVVGASPSVFLLSGSRLLRCSWVCIPGAGIHLCPAAGGLSASPVAEPRFLISVTEHLRPSFLAEGSHCFSHPVWRVDLVRRRCQLATITPRQRQPPDALSGRSSTPHEPHRH